MITIVTKSANYDQQNIFIKRSFTIRHIFALEIIKNIFQFCYLFVLYLQGHRSITSAKLSQAVGLPYLKILLVHVNAGYLDNTLARATLAVGLPYLLVNRV